MSSPTVVLQESLDPKQRAWDYYQGLQKMLKQQGKLFLVIGKLLAEIQEQKLYKDVGEGGFDTFEDFLANPEIGLGRSTAWLYIRIYKYYVEQLQLGEDEVAEIPLRRLMYLLPELKKKDDKEAREIITDVGQMTNGDYVRETKERKLNRNFHSARCGECGGLQLQIHSQQLCKCTEGQGGLVDLDELMTLAQVIKETDEVIAGQN